jgi:hypothetical protein
MPRVCAAAMLPLPAFHTSLDVSKQGGEVLLHLFNPHILILLAAFLDV